MAQIQRSVAEPDTRNIFSRILNPNKDKEAIAAWRSELDRIVHVFEVCSTVRSLPTILTVHLQIELALHTNVAIANTHELVSDMHRTLLKDKEGADSRNKTVGNHGVLFVIQKFLRLPRLKPGLQFQL